MSGGWDASAEAWIAAQGERGDYAREFVLDPAMLARLEGRRFRAALDVGCGEGRFCRVLASRGIRTTGIDPTEALIAHAKLRDPSGDYRIGRAEALEFPDESFDLVVSYLSLVDIADVATAIAEVARVLAPGGILLIANRASFHTAGIDGGWSTNADGSRRFVIDRYFEERAEWGEWRGIRIQNWHRPLGRYMSLLLAQGLVLRHFEEPVPQGGDPETTERYRRVPWFTVMEWQKL